MNWERELREKQEIQRQLSSFHKTRYVWNYQPNNWESGYPGWAYFETQLSILLLFFNFWLVIIEEALSFILLFCY